MAVKIVIADDHVMFREGLKQILELDEKIRVVAEASDGAECIEVLQNARQESEPDVLLLDIAMPGMISGSGCFEKKWKCNTNIDTYRI